MYFCVERLRGERDAAELGALYLSLNTPVIAIDELAVGPARAGVALCETREGAIQLEIAVRSLRTGQVISYIPDETLADGRDAAVAVDAALSFAEGMGFLFDEDEVAARPDGDSDAVSALWRRLVEEIPESACEPVVLSDIAVAPAAAVATDSAVVLSKFRLVLGNIAPGVGAGEDCREGGGAISVPAASQDSRIRLLSRF